MFSWASDCGAWPDPNSVVGWYCPHRYLVCYYACEFIFISDSGHKKKKKGMNSFSGCDCSNRAGFLLRLTDQFSCPEIPWKGAKHEGYAAIQLYSNLGKKRRQVGAMLEFLEGAN